MLSAGVEGEFSASARATAAHCSARGATGTVEASGAWGLAFGDPEGLACGRTATSATIAGVFRMSFTVVANPAASSRRAKAATALSAIQWLFPFGAALPSGAAAVGCGVAGLSGVRLRGA